ncbi:membrane fusion protein, multidrug efflux system [Spirosomataceae bacterium TFI 002]|nr:membrane fusion protein, multidrug efflux system [Spirosomataceae bacterium TFI 002]
MKSITIFFIGLALVFGHTSCTDSEATEEIELETKFIATSPQQLDTLITKEYVSQIRSVNHIELRALEKGYLTKIFVDEGQFVKQGQLMFQINPMVYQAERDKAKAEMDFANIEYLNTKTLADSNIVSKNELALAKAKLDKAKAELSLAEVHLKFTEIRAPFSGYMDHFEVRLGSMVDEGDLLTTLSDNSNMWVYFNVPEAEYLDYQSGKEKGGMQNVNLIMANNKKYDYTGIVKTIEADFSNETGNIAYRATFPNPKGLLRHGETGNIIVTKPLKNALLIPQKATFEVLDKNYVFVIDKDKTVRSRHITIAEEMPHLYAISSGLELGDKILLEGLRKVKEKQKIDFEYVKPELAMKNLGLYAE